MEWQTPGQISVTMMTPHPEWTSDQIGQLTATPDVDDGLKIEAALSEDATLAQSRMFYAWVDNAVSQLLESGDPHGNGWAPSAHVPGRWYMTARLVEMPDLELGG